MADFHTYTVIQNSWEEFLTAFKEAAVAEVPATAFKWKKGALKPAFGKLCQFWGKCDRLIEGNESNEDDITNNAVTINELKIIQKYLFVSEETNKEFATCFLEADKNNDGDIKFHEFCSGLPAFMKAPRDVDGLIKELADNKAASTANAQDAFEDLPNIVDDLPAEEAAVAYDAELLNCWEEFLKGVQATGKKVEEFPASAFGWKKGAFKGAWDELIKFWARVDRAKVGDDDNEEADNEVSTEELTKVAGDLFSSAEIKASFLKAFVDADRPGKGEGTIKMHEFATAMPAFLKTNGLGDLYADLAAKRA